MSKLNIREVELKDLDRCYEIESISYAGDEAATKEKIKKRIIGYPEGFIVLENSKEIIGFINSGATNRVELSDESFKELVGHDSNGKHIVIMSVVVDPKYQGRGYASLLMKQFIKQMQKLNKKDIFLISQENLIKMYQKFGFKVLGKSNSSHGGLEWYEMSFII